MRMDEIFSTCSSEELFYAYQAHPCKDRIPSTMATLESVVGGNFVAAWKEVHVRHPLVQFHAKYWGVSTTELQESAQESAQDEVMDIDIEHDDNNNVGGDGDGGPGGGEQEGTNEDENKGKGKEKEEAEEEVEGEGKMKLKSTTTSRAAASSTSTSRGWKVLSGSAQNTYGYLIIW
jgi:hypothetical protein